MKLIFKQVKLSSELNICVVDNIGGCYVNVAQALSKFFSKVYYHSVNQNPFPMVSMSSVGTGYENIERVNDFWTNVDTYDIIVFPDIYFKDWGNRLRKMGKMVWGGCPSEELETNRHLFKDELIAVGMNTAKTDYIIGINKLTKFLKKQEDVWIKISYFRGNMETFHHVNMNQTAQWLDNLKVSMGPLGDSIEFIVEQPIESIAEVGYDGFAVNGQISNNGIWGIETKDCSYIGTAVDRSAMPSPITTVNASFQPILQKYSHTGFYSNEIRVGNDGKDYYTDAAMRAGSPPSASYLDLISNWDEIIINGCKGILTEPKFKAKYVCELILKSTSCYKNYLPINIPEEYKDNVKLKASFLYNDINYIVPFEQGGLFEMDAFGSIVVIGNSVNDILYKAIEIADSLEVYGLTYDKDALNRTKKSISDITTSLVTTF